MRKGINSKGKGTEFGTPEYFVLASLGDFPCSTVDILVRATIDGSTGKFSKERIESAIRICISKGWVKHRRKYSLTRVGGERLLAAFEGEFGENIWDGSSAGEVTGPGIMSLRGTSEKSIGDRLDLLADDVVILDRSPIYRIGSWRLCAWKKFSQGYGMKIRFRKKSRREKDV